MYPSKKFDPGASLSYVDLRCPKHNQIHYPNLQHATPSLAYLEPGDVICIPRCAVVLPLCCFSQKSSIVSCRHLVFVPPPAILRYSTSSSPSCARTHRKCPTAHHCSILPPWCPALCQRWRSSKKEPVLFRCGYCRTELSGVTEAVARIRDACFSRTALFSQCGQFFLKGGQFLIFLVALARSVGRDRAFHL